MTGKTRLFAAMILARSRLRRGPMRRNGTRYHLLRAAPATFYMHVLGHGDPVRLAVALHDGLVLSKTPLAGSTAAAIKFKAIEKNVEELRANAD